MKMSEVLDTAITELERAIADKAPAIIEVASGDCANLLKAAEGYDTQLADIDRLLDGLFEASEPTGTPRQQKNWQLYTELREKYPKEEKEDEKKTHNDTKP